MQNHAQGLLVVFQQENLARLHLHIIHHQRQGLVQDLVHLQRGSQRGGDVVEQGRILTAARHGGVAFAQAFVQPRVLDGRRSVGRQHLDDLLIVGGKLVQADLFRQVDLPQLQVGGADWYAQKRAHLRVMRRIAHRARIPRQVREADRFLAVHQRADHPKPARRMLHALDLIFCHANGNELLKFPIIVQHAHGRVTRVHLFAGHGCNPLQQRLQRNILHQFQAGLVQCNQPFLKFFSRQKHLNDLNYDHYIQIYKV